MSSPTDQQQSTSVFQRHTSYKYPSVTGGIGLRLTLEDGREILDACSGGASTCCLGHGNQRVIAAARAQGLELSYVYAHHFTSEPQEKLARTLTEVVAPKMARVRFCTGGSEANETALRLARAFHTERGDSDRWQVISSAQSYHGSLSGTLALSGRASLHRNLDKFLSPFQHLHVSAWRDDPSGEKALAELDSILANTGPELVAAYFCEPVGAAAFPGYSPPRGFWEGLAERRDQHGFLICCDEIVTGVGRTGTWLAADAVGVEPDIVTLGKGLGAGFTPISAVLCTKRIYDAVQNGSADFEHGHTWDGAPLPCAIGEAVVNEIAERDLVARVDAASAPIREELATAVKDLDIVQEVRGKGFLFGIELSPQQTSDLARGEAVDIEQLVVEYGLEEGILLSASASASDGFVGDQIMLTPAFTATDAELKEMVTKTTAVLARLQAELNDHGRKPQS